MVKVKICGITNLEDAQLAIRLGADMLGFNFYDKSPRYIQPRVAAEIARHISNDVMKVGVFVNTEAYKIDEFVSQIGLDAVQIHGDEDEAFLDQLRRETNAKIIKTYRIGKDGKMPLMNGSSDFVLLDSFSESYGGSGRTFDWSQIGKLDELPGMVILAGGLTAENITEAIQKAKPFAVDVASGVEASAGKKDPKKLESFIKAAKAV
jgi:phosphoribosylanthranilate isomerase